jgi:DNA gyrase inhibitor GyrI
MRQFPVLQAWLLGYLTKQLASEGSALRRIQISIRLEVVRKDPDLTEREAFRIETGVPLQHGRKSADQQSCARQQL